MAEKPLRSLKFPNLVDTYTIAKTDPTLTLEGDPADAKAVGDALSTISNNTSLGLYGAKWDRTSNLMTRVAQAQGITTTTTNFCHKGTLNENYDNPFDSIYPWSEMKVVNVDLTAYRSGTALSDCIVAVYGDADFTYFGSNDLFVGRYVPEHWTKVVEDADGAVTYYVSQIARDGFKHVKEYVGGNLATADGCTGNYITSGAGNPLANVAVSTIHSRAKTSGFTLYDFDHLCDEIILYLVEYANMNAQSAIGDGCSSCYRQNANDVISNVSVGSNTTTFTVTGSALASFIYKGAQLSFGASSGATTYKGIVSDFSVSGSTYTITLDRALALTNGMYMSVHGFATCEFPYLGQSLGNASGYLGTNSKANVYYRGRMMYANRYQYTLGVYRQANTNHIWLCPDGVDADNYDALNASVHSDTGIALPDITAAWVTIGANASQVDGFLITGTTSGSSSSPVGDQQYVPAITTGNTILLFGGSANPGWNCGAFCGYWDYAAGGSCWYGSASPLLK